MLRRLRAYRRSRTLALVAAKADRTEAWSRHQGENPSGGGRSVGGAQGVDVGVDAFLENGPPVIGALAGSGEVGQRGSRCQARAKHREEL